MQRYSLSHLTDQALLRDLATLLAEDRHTTASVLAHLAEVDARKLYLPAGYPSMFAYCVGEFRLAEDSAAKRIRACRAAREFPAIFPAVAEGRLHLSAVVMLAPHLTPENADELIGAAMHQSKAAIEVLLAERFPQAELVARVAPLPSPATCHDHVCERSEQPAPGRVSEPPRAKVTPLAPRRYGMQVTIDSETHELLREVQALLGHTIPSGDLAQVLRESLRLAKQMLEKRRFASASKPRPDRPTNSARHVPARVRREVWRRDQGRCTFVSDSGHRCESRLRLEFDHALPVARGGEATPANLRLRCWAHNQYEAEQVYGERFMAGKRQQARERARTTPSRTATPVPAQARERVMGACAKKTGAPEPPLTSATEPDPSLDVIPWLRALGFTIAEARRAAARAEVTPGATLESRVRAALSHLSPGRVMRPARAMA